MFFSCSPDWYLELVIIYSSLASLGAKDVVAMEQEAEDRAVSGEC